MNYKSPTFGHEIFSAHHIARRRQARRENAQVSEIETLLSKNYFACLQRFLTRYGALTPVNKITPTDENDVEESVDAPHRAR
jgi:hypothetical protein